MISEKQHGEIVGLHDAALGEDLSPFLKAMMHSILI